MAGVVKFQAKCLIATATHPGSYISRSARFHVGNNNNDRRTN